ncbi:MAG: hypothetical protein AAGH79_19200 [Bacteroidota bacterium]
MKVTSLILGLISLLVLACQDEVASYSIDLDDLHTTFKIHLPSQFDTTFQWTDYTDYSCGNQQKVRFANKDYSLLQESGSMFREIPDSLCQITLYYPEVGCNKSIMPLDEKSLDSISQRRLNYYRETNTEGADIEWLVREVWKKKDQTYLVWGYTVPFGLFRNLTFEWHLVAFTYIQDTRVL